MAQNKDILDELTTYYKELKSYKRLLESKKQPLGKKPIMGIDWGHPEAQTRYRDSLREKLMHKTGGLKRIIVELTGKQYIVQSGITYDMWNEAFNPSSYLPSSLNLTALAFCIDAVNETIGKLEAERDTETTGIQWTKKDVIRKFHKALVEADKQKSIKAELSVDKGEKSAYQKIWQWIESHKVLSILGAIASIATIIGVIIACLKYLS